MKITHTKQSSLPPLDKPFVSDPVLVYMDIPLFYATERGPVPWDNAVFCSYDFAQTILQTINDILSDENMGMVHIGFYNPRKARHRDGTPIEPERWSNHAYGEAVDWKGIMTKKKQFLSVDLLHGNAALPKDLLMAVWNGCTLAIRDIGRKEEIKSEGAWMHIGIWPEGR